MWLWNLQSNFISIKRCYKKKLFICLFIESELRYYKFLSEKLLPLKPNILKDRGKINHKFLDLGQLLSSVCIFMCVTSYICIFDIILPVLNLLTTLLT